LANEARTVGEAMTDQTAWRICAAMGWWSVFEKKTHGKGIWPGPAVHDEHVNRVFTAERPNRLWLVDITEHPTRESKLYLCAVRGRVL
jgi:putative transposase